MAGPSGGYPDSPTFKTLSTTGAATFGGTIQGASAVFTNGIVITQGSTNYQGFINRCSGVSSIWGHDSNTNRTIFQTYSGGTDTTSGSSFYDMALQPYGGSLGVGTVNPTSKLDVAGTFRAQVQVLSSAPTTGNLGASYWTIVKNSTDNSVRLYVNDGGTIKSVALT